MEHALQTTGVRRSSGFTLIELMIVMVITVLLAGIGLALYGNSVRNSRETVLKADLVEMRTAIDKFKDAVDQGLVPSTDLDPGNEGYPKDLDVLVDGISAANDASGRKLKFLRHVPVDPMTHGTEWGLRSYQDKPDTTHWGGQNVFDVYTTFDGTGLDGTKYRDW